MQHAPEIQVLEQTEFRRAVPELTKSGRETVSADDMPQLIFATDALLEELRISLRCL